LHVQQGRCLEERLIGAYLGAGVDAFVVDSFTSRDVAGSTGQRYDPTLLARLSARYPTAQWLCAGGLAAEHLPELAQQLPCLAGVDIDSGARVDGRIDATRVRRLVRNLEISATRMALQ
jgi:phosphoribosylanthranilate isomerase